MSRKDRPRKPSLGRAVEQLNQAATCDLVVRQEALAEALKLAEDMLPFWGQLSSTDLLGFRRKIQEVAAVELLQKFPVTYEARGLKPGLQEVPIGDKIACARILTPQIRKDNQAWIEYKEMFLEPTPESTQFLQALYPAFHFRAEGPYGTTLAQFLGGANPSGAPLQPFFSMAHQYAQTLDDQPSIALTEALNTAQMLSQVQDDHSRGFPSRYDTWQTIATKRYGWISPDGDCVCCDAWHHQELFQRVANHYPELATWHAGRYEDLAQKLAAASQEHEDGVPEGEHPEWHVYEMWSDRQRSEEYSIVLDRLYHEGWIRVGSDRDCGLAIEGTAEAMTRHDSLLGMLEELYHSRKQGKPTTQKHVRIPSPERLKEAYGQAPDLGI